MRIRDIAYTLDLVLVESWHAIDQDPRERASKVDSLVHGKGHDSRGKDIVLHISVPRSPETLKDVE